MLAVRDEVLDFSAGFTAHDDRPFAAALLAQELHDAVDLGDHGGFLGLAGFEDLGDSRQAAGDVLRARRLARRLGQERAGGDLLALLHLDVRLLRKVIEIEDLAAGVFEHHLRVEIALVLDDHPAKRSGRVFFDAARLAVDDVLVADLAAHFGKDGDGVRIPLAEQGPLLDVAVLLDHQMRTGRHFVLLQLAALGIQQEDFAVAGEDHLLARVVAHDLQAGELDLAGRLERISLSSTARAAVPPIWKVRMVNWVPGSPMLWAAMMPTAMPSSTREPVERSIP